MGQLHKYDCGAEENIDYKYKYRACDKLDSDETRTTTIASDQSRLTTSHFPSSHTVTLTEV